LIQRRDSRAAHEELFRRRQVVVSRRRESRFLKLFKPFLAAVALVGLPTLTAIWVLTSPQLQVTEIELAGNERVDQTWLSDVLASVPGTHILWVSLEDIESRLSKHTWIERAEARKELPNRLIVSIHEKSAVALLRQGSDVFYIDRDGQIIDAYNSASDSSDLLLLSSPRHASSLMANALGVAAKLEQLQPNWALELSEIEVLNERDYRLFTGALPFPILVSLETMDSGIAAMREYLPEIARRYRVITGIDVRFSNQIVIQPAANRRTREG
jgi:cell division protein FtsQ